MFLLLLGFVVFLLWLFLVDVDLISLVYDLLHRYVIPFESRRRSLRGKVVWITGASSGIGEAIAKDLAQYGCRLILSARREDKLACVKARCVEIGIEKCQVGSFDESHVVILPFDLLKIEEHQEWVNKATSLFGRIDILINNAGRTQRCYFDDTDMEVIEAILKMNLTSHLSLTKHVIPSMKAQNFGVLVNINSVAGIVGLPNSAMYCAAKFGLRAVWNSLRLELAPYNISALTICPGVVQTDLIASAFTKDINVSYGQKVELKASSKSKWLRVTPERCAQLTTIGIVSDLREVWISKNPGLLLAYVAQYFPILLFTFGHPIAKRFGSVLRDPDVSKKDD